MLRLYLVVWAPFVGSIAWLVAGRPQRARPRSHERAEEQRRRYQEERKRRQEPDES